MINLSMSPIHMKNVLKSCYCIYEIAWRYFFQKLSFFYNCLSGNIDLKFSAKIL